MQAPGDKIIVRLEKEMTVSDYANGAISTIKNQLVTVRSANRRKKLERKMKFWNDVLNEENKNAKKGQEE